MKISRVAGWALVVITLAQTAFSTISNTPDPDTWRVGNGLVFAIVRSGDVIYLSGDFQQLVSPDGNTTIPVSGLVFFFKQKTAYEIGLGIPAEPLFRSKAPLALRY